MTTHTRHPFLAASLALSIGCLGAAESGVQGIRVYFEPVKDLVDVESGLAEEVGKASSSVVADVKAAMAGGGGETVNDPGFDLEGLRDTIATTDEELANLTDKFDKQAVRINTARISIGRTRLRELDLQPAQASPQNTVATELDQLADLIEAMPPGSPEAERLSTIAALLIQESTNHDDHPRDGHASAYHLARTQLAELQGLNALARFKINRLRQLLNTAYMSLAHRASKLDLVELDKLGSEIQALIAQIKQIPSDTPMHKQQAPTISDIRSAAARIRDGDR